MKASDSMELRIYVVGASSDPDSVRCKVPYEIDNGLIFFGPCKKALRGEFKKRFLGDGKGREDIRETVYVVGVNAANAERVRKIVWAGRVKSVMTFEEANHTLRGSRFDKMRSHSFSPLHVEPVYTYKQFVGYRIRSKEHKAGNEWVEDLLPRRGCDSNHLTEDGTLLLNELDPFPRDCCFLCSNEFFAVGRGLKITNEMVEILREAQPEKNGIDNYALFGYDARGHVIGLRGGDLKVQGCLAARFVHELKARK
jgi:hypothetical protein